MGSDPISLELTLSSASEDVRRSLELIESQTDTVGVCGAMGDGGLTHSCSVLMLVDFIGVREWDLLLVRLDSVLWWAVESTICVTDWVDDINYLKGETTVVTLVNPLFTSKLGFRGGLCWPSSQSSIVLRMLAKVEV